MPTSRIGERPGEYPGDHPGGDCEEPRSASRSRHVEPPVPGGAWLATAPMPLPRRQDHVVFLRGVPVAPWIAPRPWHAVWSTWLARLEVLFHEWEARAPESAPQSAAQMAEGNPPAVAGDERALTPLETGWLAWRETHVRSMEARRVERGMDTLRQVLADLSSLTSKPTEDGSAAAEADEPSGVHLVGHSVGGAVILAYLAHLRENPQEHPPAPLRSALTLDAAVSGLAGAWSGAKSQLNRLTGYRVMAEGLLGLNQWATEQGIRVLTVSNSGDMWSHKRLADLPYLGVHLGSRLALADQLNGAIHDWLRRTPEFVDAIWGSREGEQQGIANEG